MSYPQAAGEIGHTSLEGVEILFFDFGNVFVSDDLSGAYCYECLYAACGETRAGLKRFFEQREEHLRGSGGKRNMWSFIREHVPPGEYESFRKRVRGHIFDNWGVYSPAIKGTEQAVRELSKYYRIGLIANQPKQLVPLLEERGLSDLFEVCAISEALGMDKPDPRIFRWALEQANVAPAQAMMIGDRIDNDIRPAKKLGMKTLWYRLGFEGRGWSPETSFQKAYAESLKKYNFCDLEPESPDDLPDLVATSPEELLKLLKPQCDKEVAR
jgi:FMN phosphatase YigB (HAD superfamily)